jgi:hypothetical protein
MNNFEKYIKHIDDENVGIRFTKKHTIHKNWKSFLRKYLRCMPETEEYSKIKSSRVKDDENNFECDCGSSRSFRDVYLLVKEYYPDVTSNEIFKFICEHIVDGRLGILFCCDVDKIVIYDMFSKKGTTCNFDIDDDDELTDELYYGKHYLCNRRDYLTLDELIKIFGY